MTKSRYAVLIWVFLLSVFLFVGTASANQYSVNGTTYDTTWDGRVIPSDQIVYGSNDDVILVNPFAQATLFTVGNDTIAINNNFTSFKREKFKISPIMTFPKTLLSSKMVNVNATVAYLVFPYSLSRVKDYISDNEIRMGNWTFRAGQEHIDIYDDNETQINGTQNIFNKSAYTFRIVNDEIRLYFLKSEANKLQGNITFEMNSWTINGSTTPAWQNASYPNFAHDRNTGNLILSDAVTDGLVLYHKESGTSGITSYDMNITSNNNGTLTDMDTGLDNGVSGWNSSGKYGNAIAFDGVNDYVNAGNGASLNITDTITAEAWVYTKTLILNDPIIVRLYSGYYGWRWIFNNVGQMRFGKANSVGTYEEVSSNAYVVLTNVWQHLSVVKSGVNVTFYVNGVSVGTAALPSNEIRPVTQNLVIGYNPNNGVFFNGSIDEVRIYNRALSSDEINQTMNNTMVSATNVTSWYNAGTGNEVYQIDVNVTTPTNTNYTLWYGNNASGTWTQLGGILTGNNSETISGTKYQNTDIQVRLVGNQTATLELIQITFYDQAVSGGAGDFIPPTPINLANTTGNFWINHTWEAGSGNITNSYNISQNGTWTNGSSDTFKNVSLSPHGWSNISVYAFNNSGNGILNQTPVNMNTQILNNVPVQANIGDKQVTAGQWLNFTVSATDVDSDTITYGTNASKGAFNATTGNFNWSTTGADVGTYYWNFNSSDGYGGVTQENITVTVISGGTLYERTAADSITITEGASRTLYSFRTVSDVILVSDTTDRILFSFRTASDSIVITEGAQRIYYGVRSVSDAIIVTEYAVATFTDVGEIFTRYASDAITVVEEATRQLTYIRFTSDSISVTEGTQRFLLAFRSVSDIVSVTDSAVRIAIYNRAVQQAITVSENIQSSITEAGELFIRYVSDTITITEGAAHSWWEGIRYTVSGYVHNILGSPLENARVDVGLGFDFTNTSGYYAISDIDEGDYTVVARAIGYRNATDTRPIDSDAVINFTLNERKTPVKAPGFNIVLLFICLLSIYLYMKRGK